MPLHSGARLGAYEVTGALGAGGMGEVYRARDTQLDRDVAIKVLPEPFALDTERLARFTREAQTLAALNHPNIAQIYGLERIGADGARALVMELVEGSDLAALVAAGPLPIDDALSIARQIADALEAAHELGIVHRDLKPANVKVRPDGTVKLLDFGLAKGMESLPGGRTVPPSVSDAPTLTSPAMTQLGVILGTAAYMSPEQARGRPVDRRADIWAFGVVLYEMLTGVRPFGGETTTDTLSSIVSREPDWTRLSADARRRVGPLLQRCLEKDPRRRLQAMGEARIALDGPPPPPGAVPGRTVAVTAAVVLVTGALALAAAAMWAAGRGATPASSTASAVWLALPVSPAESLSGAFTLSPDGRQLAFVGQSGGRNQIFLRRLEQPDATVLPGTEGATLVGPAFSPDGRWLVFSASGALKKVPTDGGPVVVLTGASRTIAGAHSRPAWGPDGTIVFSTSHSGLARISADGGQADVLSSPDAKEAEVSHEMPFFLPDGRTLLFSIRRSAAAANTGALTVVAHRLDTGERRALFPGLVLGLVGDDQLIVSRADSILTVPFDRDRLLQTADAVPLASEVRAARREMFSVAPQFAVARNGTMVLLSSTAERSRPMMLVDRSGTATAIAAPIHLYSDPRVSPDGQKIAVHVFEDGRDNWVLDLRNGAFTRLTFDVGEDETPVWSPDGKWIFWTASRGNVNRAIYRRPADGSGAEQMVWSGDAHVHLGGVTPDGSTIVISLIEGQYVRLASIAISDGKLTPLLTTPFDNNTPSLSPDGKWVAYTSDESGQVEVYVQPFPSMQGRTQVSAGGGSEPVWARSGRELYYRGRGKIMAVAVSTADGFSAEAPRPLFDDRIGNAQGEGHVGYDVTPAGRFVIVSRPTISEGAVTHLKILYRP